MNTESKKQGSASQKMGRRDHLVRRLKSLLDLEHTKVAVSTSLLSVVVLVTLANNNLMSKVTPVLVVAQNEMPGGRGIASVGASASLADSFISENPKMLAELAKHNLGPKASIGQNPTSLDKLAFGYLEGKYAVRLQHGTISEIEISESSLDEAKHIESLSAFIENQRALLPDFRRSVKAGDEQAGSETLQVYELMNEKSAPIAKVQFRTDDAGRFIAMRVVPLQIAAK
jgi:hypothetical protein